MQTDSMRDIKNMNIAFFFLHKLVNKKLSTHENTQYK